MSLDQKGCMRSDIWQFNGSFWTLISGDTSEPPADGLRPAGRSAAVGWTDAEGNALLCGSALAQISVWS